jgi:HK97 family phage prohead protease
MEYKNGGIAIPNGNGNNEGWEISGYASWFNERDLGGDVVKPGAYTASLKQRPSVPLLWQHDTGEVIGKTLLMHEDNNGLFFKAQIIPTRRGQDARLLTQAGAVSGVSIGYDAIDPLIGREGRTLPVIDLMEISLVTFPMMPKAQLTPTTGKMRDMLTIAEIEAKQAANWGVSDYEMAAYLTAHRRELERLVNAGYTDREMDYKLLFEIQELKKKFR